MVLNTDGGAASVAELGVEGYWEIAASDVQQIEKALVALRKQYASAEAVSEGHAGTRNSVANLVIYAGSEQEADRAGEAVRALAGRHPARTILLIADGSPGDPEVRASVTAHCHLIGAQRRVCYEQIELRVRGRSGPQLRSIVDPLLLSDLPVFLWWTGEASFRDEVFRTLVGLSTRVLLDSDHLRNPVAGLSRLSRFVQEETVTAAVGDLNWNRLRPWRELIAQLFDPPQMQEMLGHLRRVRAIMATRGDTDEANPSQALLLLGWLAARLDWQPPRQVERTFSGAYRFHLRGGGYELQVELRAEFARDARPGDVQELQVEADNGGSTALITVTRATEQESAFTSVSIGGAPPAERNVRFQNASDAVLIGEEMEYWDRDPVYEEALDMAGRLAELMPDSP
jgi:glucose-6-phosphate dehydrogenase assembly protein OpcA